MPVNNALINFVRKVEMKICPIKNSTLKISNAAWLLGIIRAMNEFGGHQNCIKDHGVYCIPAYDYQIRSQSADDVSIFTSCLSQPHLPAFPLSFCLFSYFIK